MEESIQHLLFDRHVAKFMWNALYYAFDFVPPSGVVVSYHLVVIEAGFLLSNFFGITLYFPALLCVFLRDQSSFSLHWPSAFNHAIKEYLGVTSLGLTK